MIVGPAERLIQNALLEPVHGRRVDRRDVPRIAADVPNRLDFGGVAVAVLTAKEMKPDPQTREPARSLEAVTGNKIGDGSATLHLINPLFLASIL